jgi:2-polyprenyl-3-methyl-5-hydroxy-6-metoxy-1,4-benzoquinol methylase
MARLTQEGFWEESYKAPPENSPASPKNKLRLWAEKLLGQRLVGYTRDYDDYLLWEVIYRSHFARIAGAKALEVGSAPGHYLVRLNREFGVIPYGIEYTESGAELNKRIFTSNGLNPANVIHADFFSQAFQNQYKEYFDIVISRGFMEHFDDVAGVIEKHLALLKPGGRLIVSVPNFRGVYYVWLRLFRKKVLAMHNLTIMQKSEFIKLFRAGGLSTLFCGYYGTFSLNHLHAPPGSPLRFITAFLHNLQKLFNLLFRLAFAHKGRESRFFSPHLLFMGVKSPQAVVVPGSEATKPPLPVQHGNR